jgi:hypothetical protein
MASARKEEAVAGATAALAMGGGAIASAAGLLWAGAVTRKAAQTAAMRIRK